jgi:hypothetical protein
VQIKFFLFGTGKGSKAQQLELFNKEFQLSKKKKTLCIVSRIKLSL